MKKKKIIILSFIVYVFALVIASILPASEGYNTLTWKLLIGQIYAVPSFVIVFLIIHSYSKKRTP